MSYLLFKKKWSVSDLVNSILSRDPLPKNFIWEQINYRILLNYYVSKSADRQGDKSLKNNRQINSDIVVTNKGCLEPSGPRIKQA